MDGLAWMGRYSTDLKVFCACGAMDDAARLNLASVDRMRVKRKGVGLPPPLRKSKEALRMLFAGFGE